MQAHTRQQLRRGRSNGYLGRRDAGCENSRGAGRQHDARTEQHQVQFPRQRRRRIEDSCESGIPQPLGLIATALLIIVNKGVWWHSRRLRALEAAVIGDSALRDLRLPKGHTDESQIPLAPQVFVADQLRPGTVGCSTQILRGSVARSVPALVRRVGSNPERHVVVRVPEVDSVDVDPFRRWITSHAERARVSLPKSGLPRGQARRGARVGPFHPDPAEHGGTTRLCLERSIRGAGAPPNGLREPAYEAGGRLIRTIFESGARNDRGARQGLGDVHQVARSEADEGLRRRCHRQHAHPRRP